MTEWSAAALALMFLWGPVALAGGSAKHKARPGLFFDQSDVRGLRDKCGGGMRGQFEALVEYADEHIADTPPKLEGDYEERGLKVEHPYLTNILDFSFLYVVTGEAKYLEAAKRWALFLASMEEWAGPAGPNDVEGDRGLYAGFGLTALACAYDWLYQDLALGEREILRRKIYSITERLYRATFEGEWWSKAYLHHDHWIPVGAMGLGALALWGEAPEAARWARQAEEEFTRVFERLGDDGAWHEGVCGWAFGMASFAPFWDASRRRGLSRLTDSEWLRNTWRFRLYSRLGDGRFATFGDGRATGNYQWTAWQAAPVLRLLAARFQNPYAQWLAAREWETRPNPYTAVWEIIWADADLEERPPDGLSACALFSNEGLAVLRTGWGDNAAVVAFHCDSVVGERAVRYYADGDDRINTGANHAHADANSFVFWADGDFAVVPAGYGQRETRYQNSMEVDGEGQYRLFDRQAHPGRPSGKVTRFFDGCFGSFVTGEAAKCYAEGLESFERTVYLVRPGILFVVDHVRSERPATLDWFFHVESESAVELRPGGFSCGTGTRRTHVDFAADGSPVLTVEDHRRTLGIRVRLDEATSRTRMVSVISRGMTPRIQRHGRSAWVIDTPGARTLAAFGPPGGKLEIPGKLSARASCAIAGADGFLAVDVTRLVIGSKEVLTSDAPLTASCLAQAGKVVLTLQGGAAEVTFDAASPVKTITTADGEIPPFTAVGSQVSLDFPGGRAVYEIALD